MELKLYQVDAFTEKLFAGNPAAVCPLKKWIDENKMQAIAAENNLSETAFFVKNGNRYHIRWFTPTDEVELCGHATLATSYVIFEILKLEDEKIIYDSLSGELIVTKNNDLITLNFPAKKPEQRNSFDELKSCVSVIPKEVYFNKSYLLLLSSEEEVKNTIPNLGKIAALNSDGLIITAKGNDVDFVSRYFAPHIGINEDPVTGAAHTILTPFWSEKLDKQKFTARQLSKRGGDLVCEYNKDRVLISGKAKLYLEGTINI